VQLLKNSNVEIKLGKKYSWLEPAPSKTLSRFGGDGDGGYVLSENVPLLSEYLLSFGLGANIDFELSIKKSNPLIAIDVYDHTVQRPNKKQARINLAKSLFHGNLTHYKSYMHFYKSYNEVFLAGNHNRNKVTNFKFNEYDIDIKDLLAENLSSSIILKVDIEGDEYRILPSIIKNAQKFTAIIIEFHNIGVCRVNFEKYVKEISKSHVIEHVHANNFSDLTSIGLPDVMEVTFIRKDLYQSGKKERRYPIDKLDCPNTHRRRDFMIEWTTR
jgi:hypothetical protein